MLLEDMVETLGYRIAGSFQTLDTALEAVSADPSAFDAAILDINLNGLSSLPVAELLRTKGIPYFFSTGYGEVADDDAPARLTKPFSIDDLRLALDRLN
jgi:CheY-like chemotaxis protein